LVLAAAIRELVMNLAGSVAVACVLIGWSLAGLLLWRLNLRHG